jgi:hypothetical protein
MTSFKGFESAPSTQAVPHELETIGLRELTALENLTMSALGLLRESGNQLEDPKLRTADLHRRIDVLGRSGLGVLGFERTLDDSYKLRLAFDPEAVPLMTSWSEEYTWRINSPDSTDSTYRSTAVEKHFLTDAAGKIVNVGPMPTAVPLQGNKLKQAGQIIDALWKAYSVGE